MSEPPRRAEGTSSWWRTAILGLFVVHVACSGATFLTMDADVPVVRDVLDLAVDTYEFVGFGIYPLGIVLVTAALVAGWLWAGRR